jgi:hypothetical protein
MLIYAQANRSPYTSVSVLLLRWEDDLSVEQDLLQLQKVFRERFNYRTESWSIPSCANPSIKLTMQMASYIECARSDHLLIVYYAGYGFVGLDHHLYWAWYDLNSHSLIAFADDTLATLEKNLPGSNGKVYDAYSRMPSPIFCSYSTPVRLPTLLRLAAMELSRLLQLTAQIRSHEAQVPDHLLSI